MGYKIVLNDKEGTVTFYDKIRVNDNGWLSAWDVEIEGDKTKHVKNSTIQFPPNSIKFVKKVGDEVDER